MEGFGGFLVWYLIFLVSLTLHEAAHALAALWGGDDTAYRGGQVTIDPWPHIRREPFGTVLIPILSYFSSGFMMGWASAPYNRIWGRRYPRRMAAMSAAGPAANLLLALLAFIALKALLAGGVFVAPETANFDHVVEAAPALAQGRWAGPLAFGLSIALNLNMLLFLFNLIPLPPLDGSGILSGLFPASVGRLLETLMENQAISILGLLVAWKFFRYGPVFRALLSILHPGHDYR
jgi:Zn-dependent protease